jgi:hypothetical protein
VRGRCGAVDRGICPPAAAARPSCWQSAQIVLENAAAQCRLRRGVECAAGKGRPGWRAAEGDVGTGATLGALPPEAREVHGRFMRLVFELIDGSLDPGQYEDAVRALLGAPR